jgi:rod shape-determining protein MreD
MSLIISIPLLGILTVFQSAVISRLPLIQGTADLVLVLLIALALQKSFPAPWQWGLVGGLLVDFYSGLPFGVYTFSYLLIIGFAVLIRERIWRFSFLMQLLVVLIGTLLIQGISYIILFLEGVNLPFSTVLQAITLPSIVLNFMLSLPVFILAQDSIEQVYPTE